MEPKKIGLAVLAGITVIVLLQNTQVVSVRFLFWRLSMSQIILLPLIFAAGTGLGFWLGRRSWD